MADVAIESIFYVGAINYHTKRDNIEVYAHDMTHNEHAAIIAAITGHFNDHKPTWVNDISVACGIVDIEDPHRGIVEQCSCGCYNSTYDNTRSKYIDYNASEKYPGFNIPDLVVLTSDNSFVISFNESTPTELSYDSRNAVYKQEEVQRRERLDKYMKVFGKLDDWVIATVLRMKMI